MRLQGDEARLLTLGLKVLRGGFQMLRTWSRIEYSLFEPWKIYVVTPAHDPLVRLNQGKEIRQIVGVLRENRSIHFLLSHKLSYFAPTIKHWATDLTTRSSPEEYDIYSDQEPP